MTRTDLMRMMLESIAKDCNEWLTGEDVDLPAEDLICAIRDAAIYALTKGATDATA